MTRRASKLIGVVAAMVAAAGPSRSVMAQEPPSDQSIEVQLFQPAVGRQSFLTVSGAELMGDKQFQVGLAVTYMTGALTVYNVDPMDNLETRTEVIESVLGGQLGGSYGLRDKYQLGVVVPIIFSLSGEGLDPSTAEPMPGGLSVAGFGDASIELAYRVWGREGLTVAAIPAFTLPTSTSLGSPDNAFLGDDLPSFRPRAAVEWTSIDGKFSAGANLGFIFRKPRTLYSTDVGQQVTYAAAGAYHVNGRVDVVAEMFGRNGFGDDLDASPLEGDAAVRVDVTRALTVTVGGGTGLVAGLGSPGMRVFAAVSWAPDFGDSDGDGINNMRDRCPSQAEDRDGYMDHDGCVDSDNDSDLFADSEDKCPDEAEDKDGFNDEDGCPDPDNDGDGILDDRDRCTDFAEDKVPPYVDDGCPANKRDSDDDGITDAFDKCITDFEDLDGFQDDDGCPDPDNDGDGVLDENDTQCPTDAEDRDSFNDEDGCPDLDNDEDGFADATDQCPNERETVNGVSDFDGCPDPGGKTLAYLDGNKVVLEERVIFEEKKADIKKRSFNLLDQVAVTMRGEPDVVQWRIVVAAEKQRGGEANTRALSQKRADAVKAYLVSKGVPEDRLEAVGVVADSPTVVFAAAKRKSDAEPPPAGGETIPDDPPPTGVAPPADAEPEIEMEPTPP